MRVNQKTITELSGDREKKVDEVRERVKWITVLLMDNPYYKYIMIKY